LFIVTAIEQLQDNNTKKTIGIPEARQGQVRSWSEMSFYLDQMFPNTEKICLKFARVYFKAQKLFAEGEDKGITEEKLKRAQRARNIFEKLEKINGYMDFEAENIFMLKTIDIGVRGKSNWTTDDSSF
jgi:hypothetical protein